MDRSEISVKLGISSCLLGEKVRYDGGHKRDSFIVDRLSKFYEFVPLCPEVGIGMGVPREPIELRQCPSGVRALRRGDSSIDYTDRLYDYAVQTASRLGSISGYLFKSKSPSCGLHDVPIRNLRNELKDRNGSGIYASSILSCLGNLPVEDEVRLQSPDLLDMFLERVEIYRNWRALPQPVAVAELLRFHAKHEFNAESRSSAMVKELAGICNSEFYDASVAEHYFALLMDSLQHPPTPSGHRRALFGILVRLEPFLDRSDRLRLHQRLKQFDDSQITLRELQMSFKPVCKRLAEFVDFSAYIDAYPNALLADCGSSIN